MALYPETQPALISPLTDKQHAQLGRIAVLWGHIDFVLDELLLNVLKLSITQRKMFIGEKPMGPKMDLIKPEISKIKDGNARDLTQRFYDLLNDTKRLRNHAFHGIWGWRAVDRGKKVEVCARHPKEPNNPLKASDLPALEAKLCRASHVGFDALAALRKWPPPAGVNRFSHGKAGPPPKWYARWLEQHPLVDANLDHSWLEGELPRLIDPLG
ncbi:hypothetical protein [Sphingomonas sp.]|uniref:hypothetical protein n=1 Tax=Sphingomonas sp. TaxID=28214 RepID=UPI0025ED2790|nr:hypothetical protein [Sphingomonas sp.]